MTNNPNIISGASGSAHLPASIEVSPKQVLDGDGIGGLFPSETRVYVTDIGNDTVDRIVDTARRITDLGYIPVPHIPARRLVSEADLATRIRRFAEEAGATEALLIAGSPPHQQGPYSSSMEILQSGLLERHGFKRIGVAGHPEGSPDISKDDIVAALQQKNAFARQSDMDFFIITQFGFDGKRMVDWAHGLSQVGNTLPVHIGLAGPAKITTLLKYAAMCGVGASMSFLSKRASALATLATSYKPDAVADTLEAHAESGTAGPISQLHVYPFGGVRKSAAWLAERGTWSLDQGPTYRSLVL